jgi:hypothetical protein
MEPFEREELNDRELSGLLREWKAPDAPPGLRAAVFGPAAAGEAPLHSWRKFWSLSIRVPAPVAFAAALLLAAAVWAGWPLPQPVAPRPASPPQVIVETKTVEVPVVKERVVYRDRPQPYNGWKPVAELRPRIIRSSQHEN